MFTTQNPADRTWTVHDATTGTALLTADSHDDLNAVWRTEWVDRERIGETADAEVPRPAPPETLPESLVDSITEWVLQHPSAAAELIRRTN